MGHRDWLIPGPEKPIPHGLAPSLKCGSYQAEDSMIDRNQPKKSYYILREGFFYLLNLRLGENNRRMIEQLTKEAQRLNARGLLCSSMAVTAKHKVLESILKESVGIIIKTVMDIIRKNDLLIDEEEIQELCSEALSKRRDEIEGHYPSEKGLIKLGLPNIAMLKGFLSLNESYNLQR